jgi:hypothetical protein
MPVPKGFDMLRPILACCAALTPALAAAAPAEPTSKWAMEYSPTACTAKRAFGDKAIAITPSPLGVTTRIVLDVPGRAVAASHVNSSVDPGDGGGRISTTSIIFPTSRKGHRGIYTVMNVADAKRILDSGRLTLVTGQLSDREMITDRAIDLTGASFNLGKMGALNAALETCMADLRKHWNIVNGTIVPPANRAKALRDVRTLFRADDYPEDARSRDLKGVTQFTLMIDENGAVADCLIAQTSGIGVLDAMGCQVLRERARFAPASDESGKKVADTFVTPVVRWVLN